MKKNFSFIVLIIFTALVQLPAQSHISRQISELEKDFRSFQYQKVLEKGNFLLTDPYVTKQDSLQILKYMLTSAYALADTTTAKKIIHKIIKCDPHFALNPRDTSPKIIEFYEHVKEQIKAHKPVVPINPIIKTVVKPVALPTSSSLFSLLLPGSGHLHQKFKKKGMAYSGISVALIGGLVYTIVQTEKKEARYLEAKPGADFNRLYDDYNRFYKTRNLLMAAFLIWDIYAYYDLNREWQIRVKSRFLDEGLALQLTWHW